MWTSYQTPIISQVQVFCIGLNPSNLLIGMTLRKRIQALHAAGKSYNQIVDELKCSKGTVAYHCSDAVKKKTHLRKEQWKRANTLAQKLHNFCHPNQYKRKLYGVPKRSTNLNLKSLTTRIGDSPKCYITGVPININNPEEYSLDHIVPLSKGGIASLENCGLASQIANMVKSDLTYEELILMCRTILRHHENGGPSQHSS